MNHIHRIGLEIEGGWFTDSRPISIKGDSSVRFKRREFKIRGQTRAIQLGEIASPPLESIQAATDWINPYWPDKRNETCGYHIHTSLKCRLRYAYLMDSEFNELFLDSAHKFGHQERMSKEFFARLEGKNQFCKRMFKPEEQINFLHNHHYTPENPRYAQLNYCFQNHGTVENRLPNGNMTKGKAVKTLNWYINLIETYLDKKINSKDKDVIEISVPFVPTEGQIFDLTKSENMVTSS
jgi:hypothetical protein